ncbi:MAG: hypothetical protein HeimC2_19890 [Candidatus Heimdallarchaeota archaeon LC_2]|nr:MAG: hypothetical protein HeimC2_19890 [Candidatus Heimdallarchaeota archaeon LC_2]
MQLVEECYSCILKRTNGILLRKNIDLKLQNQIMNKIAKTNESLNASNGWLNNKINRICPAQLGTNRQKILELNNLGNTYQKEKNIGHELGSYFWKVFKNKKMNLEEKLIISLFGNGIEFDVGGNYTEITQDKMIKELHTLFQDTKLQKTAKETALKISTKVNQGDLVLFLLDNVGENYLDALLIQALLDSGIDVEAVVKGGPILNDVTRSDMQDFPIDVQLWDTGNSDVGLFLNRIPEQLLNRINEAKLLIIKGMAQFETLSSEILPTDAIYLMKVKCNPVAEAVNSELGRYIIHYQTKDYSWL